MDKPHHHIIGTGRWGTWLARRLQSSGFEIASLRNRSSVSAKRLAKELDVPWSSNDFEKGVPFEANDLVWCCVPDAELVKLSRQLTQANSQVCIIHCSGTSSLLEGECTGVFWPIQSFTLATEPDWSNLPIIVQSASPAFAKTLLEIASRLSGVSPKLVSKNEDRMRLHLGAVMTQNFSNLLWTLTEEVLAEAELDYKDLLPLAENHLKKLAQQSPARLQTGPASRKDQNTLLEHKVLLKDHSVAKEIYALLSEHITKKEN